MSINLHLSNSNNKLKTQFDNISNESVIGGKKTTYNDQSFPLTGFKNYVETEYKIDYTQGSINRTGNALDLAISGEELFVVQDHQNQTFYTRNGSFRKNAEGYIQNDQGYYLLAKNVQDGTQDDLVNNWNQLERVQIHTEQLSTVKATSEIQLDFTVNLTDFEETTTTNKTIIDNLISVYDEMGENYSLSFKLNQVGNKQDRKIEIIIEDNQNNILYRQETSFGTNPREPLIQVPETTITAYGRNITIPTPTITMWEMGREQSSQLMTQQDGNSFNQYLGLEVSEGIMYAKFTSEIKMPLYKIGIAHFINPEKLTSYGAATFSSSSQSGDAQISNKHSVIKGSSLESSNINAQDALLDTTTISHSIKGSHRALSTDYRLIDNFLQETK